MGCLLLVLALRSPDAVSPVCPRTFGCFLPKHVSCVYVYGYGLWLMTMYYELWHMYYVSMSMAELLQLHMSPVHCSLDRVRCGSFSFTLNKLATETPRKNSLRSGVQSSRPGGARMKGVSQSRKDANTRMRTKNSRHCNSSVISSNIAHVNTASNICNPKSYIRQSLCIATWNVLSLVSSSSQLFQLSQNITQFKLDVLGITETHMPGSGTDILDNGALNLFILAELTASSVRALA